MRRGNCYVTCEALYHLLGGAEAGWVPKRFPVKGDTHWFLYNTVTEQVLDPTSQQFDERPSTDDYYFARSGGFLTKKPSKRAQAMMDLMLWQEDKRVRRTPISN